MFLINKRICICCLPVLTVISRSVVPLLYWRIWSWSSTEFYFHLCLGKVAEKNVVFCGSREVWQKTTLFTAFFSATFPSGHDPHFTKLYAIENEAAVVKEGLGSSGSEETEMAADMQWAPFHRQSNVSLLQKGSHSISLIVEEKESMLRIMFPIIIGWVLMMLKMMKRARMWDEGEEAAAESGVNRDIGNIGFRVQQHILPFINLFINWYELIWILNWCDQCQSL